MATKPELLQAALEVRFTSDAGHDLSVRDYLRKLLEAVWTHEESFSGKRPFGNSGWKYDVYAPLIKAGFLKGELDSEDYIVDCDTGAANLFVCELIHAAFQPSAELYQWRENAALLLDETPKAVRMCEGGGPEDLLQSLIVTFIKLRDRP